jgi:hypothetical protein
MRRWLWAVLVGLALCWGVAPSAEAQTYIGQYRWQIVPYCDVFVGNITATGEAYIFSGWHETCDYWWHDAAFGVMFINPDGTVGGGFTGIRSDGFPIHYDVWLTDLATLSGTWRSSDGTSGDFVRQ